MARSRRLTSKTSEEVSSIVINTNPTNVDEENLNEKYPLCDGTNYVSWSIRMKVYLMTLGYGIWDPVSIEYTTLKNPSIGSTKKESSENNKKEMDVILRGLS